MSRNFEVIDCTSCPMISSESGILEVGRYCILYDILHPDEGTLGIKEGEPIPEKCDLRDGTIFVKLHPSKIKKGCKQCGTPTFGPVCARCKGERA